jgi:hypothetical protein
VLCARVSYAPSSFERIISNVTSTKLKKHNLLRYAARDKKMRRNVFDIIIDGGASR